MRRGPRLGLLEGSNEFREKVGGKEGEEGL